jgi:DNA-binding response OmpR family regulator
MTKILLVEDEKNFGLVLKDYLRIHDLEVHWCENGEEGITVFREQKFDLCILDVMMPRKDGFTMSKDIRALDADVPIIFLTARGRREDMLKGYRAGADDYIVKPFDSELLLLKIQAILKRRTADEKISQQDEFEIGPFQFNARTRQLKKTGAEEQRLSPKEAALLKILVEHRDRVLSKEKALKQIWKESTYFTGRSMDVYITKLRKYLAPHAEISNVHGDGYLLTISY